MKYALEDAFRAMPLELFLQVVGSTQKADDMMKKCKQGKRLSELPSEEYKLLMDTLATGRLSMLIDILRRLKVIITELHLKYIFHESVQFKNQVILLLVPFLFCS